MDFDCKVHGDYVGVERSLSCLNWEELERVANPGCFGGWKNFFGDLCAQCCGKYDRGSSLMFREIVARGLLEYEADF